MANLSLLRTYATKAPSEFPDSVLFTHTERTLTIYDAYPKAIFHFLALPRIHNQTDSGLSLKDLHSLKTLLACDKTRAKELVTALKDDSEEVKKDIESEMVRRYGFKWPNMDRISRESIDAVCVLQTKPSREPLTQRNLSHLHLHIISADLCSEKLKHKKHYNSFHPKLGFFLHVDDVLSWFDSEPSYFSQVSSS
ncbi:aprataxin-like protein [Marasmius tenuissimus]|uniref:Aprataxin-like protein n=1 Tax=Marasmius tenuissimus TaxID=585030 RepID=A0ABR3ADX2_9AGAR